MTIGSSFVCTLSRALQSTRPIAGALAVVAMTLGGCHPTVEPTTGQAQVSILALSAADVAKVNLTVNGPALQQPMVFSLFQKGNAWGGLVGGIPA